MKNLFLKVAGGVLFLITFSSCKPKVEVTPHFHSFGETWTSDAENHWHEATCEHDVVKGKSNHNWDSGKITESPTCIKDGVKIFTCEICRREKTEILEKSGHQFGEWISNHDSTNLADGTKSRNCIVCLFKETVVDEGSKLPKTDYSLCVVGDYILKDGTVLSKNETPESSVIAAVIVRESSEDKPCLGVGIWQSRTCLRWCTKTAEGYNKNITALQGKHESGYMDGRDGWKILKETCSDAEEHPEYYPAWNYSLTYAETNGLKGDLAKGWYFPTASELYTIYLNKETIDASLSKAACDLSFSDNFFWSCSQRPNDLYAWGMSFGDGNGGGDSKHLEDYYVCSVKAFE